MLEDGTLYFVVLTLLNIADIIVYTITDGAQELSVFISPISAILTSHFLLHIRKAANHNMHIESQTPSFVHTGDVMPTRSWISSVEFAPHIAVPSSGEVDEGDIGADSVDGEECVGIVDGELRLEEGEQDAIELEVLGGGAGHQTNSDAAGAKLE